MKDYRQALRLAKIVTVEATNIFLCDIFLPKFNARFSVVPKDANNLHRVLTSKECTALDATFSIQHLLVIRNDFTVSYENAWYQIRPTLGLTPRPKETVTVEVRRDGTPVVPSSREVSRNRKAAGTTRAHCEAGETNTRFRICSVGHKTCRQPSVADADCGRCSSTANHPNR